tara:strand:+ start:2174 stop:2377 length:204 start_codon:yes stop_codon:yes gene_type:complete
MQHSKHDRRETVIVGLIDELEELDEQRIKACAELYYTIVVGTANTSPDNLWSYLLIGRRHRYLTKEG